MAQHLWRVVGLCKPTALSLCKTSRLFSSFHPVKAYPSDPVKRKALHDRKMEYRRMKRLTDLEWALHDKAVNTKHYNYRAYWADEKRQSIYQNNNERVRRKCAEDPEYRLRVWLTTSVRRNAFMRERLPWKSHTPVLYQDKVQHTCSTCLVPRMAGGCKLWWASHDGEHYQCSPCYFNGSNIMPKGYEDVSSMAELKKRMDELGH